MNDFFSGTETVATSVWDGEGRLGSVRFVPGCVAEQEPDSGGGQRAGGAGPARPSRSSADPLNQLQPRLTFIEEPGTARLADALNKVTELQANHMALSRELATATVQVLNLRWKLLHASDEIDTLNKKHSRQIMEFLIATLKRNCENREVKEDLKVCMSDLARERETVSALKMTISHQSTAHLTLMTQNHALEVQSVQLQSQIDLYSRTVSEVTLKLESAQNHIEAMNKEAMDTSGGNHNCQ